MLRIITYHRVAPLKHTPLLNPRMISATPEIFHQQMRFITSKYNVIAMENVLNAVEKGTSLPDRCVLITFDDAYCDVAEFAWPILKDLNLPATIFVPTGYPDRPERAFWWDRLYQGFEQAPRNEIVDSPIGYLPLHMPETRIQNLKRLQNYIKTLEHGRAMALVDKICSQLGARKIVQKSVLDWDDLRKLTREGVALGAHTRTHPMMTKLSEKEIREEITGSRADLAREIGYALPIFCYPSGGHSDNVVDILKQENFKLAVTTLDGQNDLQCADPFRLRRTNITRKTTLPVFRLRLTRWMTAVDSWRHRKETAIVGRRG